MRNIARAPFRFFSLIAVALLLQACAALNGAKAPVGQVMGTGDLGVIIERATGSVLIVNTSSESILHRVEGLGDLSHASLVYSRDARYAYVFGRDGALTKVDLLTATIVNRVIQSGNSIGGAISQDGQYVAVSNYTPGGVRVFRADTLEMVADLPAVAQDGQQGKTVGLVDIPGNKFVFSLFDGGETWVLDMTTWMAGDHEAAVTKYRNVGKQPYDALVSPDGRFYIAGLFGEDGMALLDTWYLDKGVKRIMGDYGRGDKKLPVFKMPHLEGWAIAGNHAFVPAVGLHEVLVVDMNTWALVQRIPVHSQPVFVMARPDGRYVWVNFAFPDNDTLQVIDTETRQIVHTEKAGDTVLHMEFSPRGERLWVSIRGDNQVCIYDTATLKRQSCLPAQSPSGIFFTDRAHKTGL